MTTLWAAGGGALAAALVACASYASSALARRLLGRGGPPSIAVTWAAAGVVGVWSAGALFHLLAPWGAFTPLACLGGWALAALVVRLALDRDGRHARALGRELAEVGGQARALLLARWEPLAASPLHAHVAAVLAWAAGALLVASTARALATPPLAWDAFTYHLMLAGQWVRAGGHFALEAPDAWTYYRYFPAHGDVWSAWVLLPFGGDLAANLANLPLWGLAGLGSYALARELGVGRPTALLGAAAVVHLPAVAYELRTAYVEIGLLAEVLCGLLFLVRALRSGRGGELLLGSAALGCALATKHVALPPVAAALGLFALARAFGRRETGPAPRTGPLALLACALLPLCVAAPWYARAWLEQGSPLHPFPAAVAGFELGGGAPSLARLIERTNDALARAGGGGWLGLERYLPLVGAHYSAPGPVAALAALAAPLGARLAWRRGHRRAVLLVAGSVGAMLAGFLTPELRGIRVLWLSATGRFLALPAAGLLVLALPALDGRSSLARLARAALCALLAFELWLDLPLDWAPLAAERPLAFAGGAALALAGVGALAGLAAALERARRSAPLVLGLALAAVAALPVVAHGRAQRRYAAFQELSDHRSTSWRASVPAWELCDAPDRPRRIAFAAGYRRAGHNWFWYPLLGSRLQNAVTYVPVTRDGALVDYELDESVRELASFPAWLERLDAARIDTLVCFPPAPIEAEWARAHPELFEVELATGKVDVFRVRRGRLRERLDAGG